MLWVLIVVLPTNMTVSASPCPGPGGCEGNLLLPCFIMTMQS